MKRYGKRIAVLVLSMMIVIAGLTAVSALGEFRVHCEAISDKVLRLHILANSDSEEDQALKLKVRDAILAESGALFNTTDNKSDAMKNIVDNKERIAAIAESTLRENGCGDTVTAELAEVYFNTRTYDEITMPAGYYDALQVKIGDAEGKNWWCVMFPAMCVPSSSAQIDDVLTAEEMDVVTGGYTVRLKVVEWYEAFLGLFR